MRLLTRGLIYAVKALYKILLDKFPTDIQKRALGKLKMLNAAITLQDLLNIPGNYLEKKKGKLKGYMSIRVNDQWRICFK